MERKDVNSCLVDEFNLQIIDKEKYYSRVTMKHFLIWALIKFLLCSCKKNCGVLILHFNKQDKQGM